MTKTINTIIEDGTIAVYCNGLKVNKAWAIQEADTPEWHVTLTAKGHVDPFIYEPREDSLNLVLTREAIS